MGRPPYCDKDGIKKGPWTTEEDVILASYVREHGPGNWKSVPTNTGLLRCSKSCRLRWTNYLRPGIKRGNFTSHEERMIVHLQSMLGNKWASIASYLPQRTDNDIKNYWNTHLKKKIKKFDKSSAVALDPSLIGALNADSTTSSQLLHRKYADHINKSACTSLDLMISNRASSRLRLKHQSSAIYASSAENISRLLEDWMKSPSSKEKSLQSNITNNENNTGSSSCCSCSCNSNNNGNVNVEIRQQGSNQLVNKGKVEDQADESCDDLIANEEFESLLSFEGIEYWEKSDIKYSHPESHQMMIASAIEKLHLMSEAEEEDDEQNQPPLSSLEKWLWDEAAGHAEELMELSPIF